MGNLTLGTISPKMCSEGTSRHIKVGLRKQTETLMKAATKINKQTNKQKWTHLQISTVQSSGDTVPTEGGGRKVSRRTIHALCNEDVLAFSTQTCN